MFIDILYCLAHSLKAVELPFDQTLFRCEPAKCFVPLPNDIEADVSCAVLQRLYAWGMMQVPANERAQLRASSEIAQTVLECLERDFSAKEDFIFFLSKHGHLNVSASPSYTARLIYKQLLSNKMTESFGAFGLSKNALKICESITLGSLLELSELGIRPNVKSNFFQRELKSSFPSAVEFLATLSCGVNSYQELTESTQLTFDDKLMFLALCVDNEIDERRYLNSLKTEANVPFFLRSVLEQSSQLIDAYPLLLEDSSALENFLFGGSRSEARPWTHTAVLGELRAICLMARRELLSPSLFHSEQSSRL